MVFASENQLSHELNLLWKMQKMKQSETTSLMFIRNSNAKWILTSFFSWWSQFKSWTKSLYQPKKDKKKVQSSSVNNFKNRRREKAEELVCKASVWVGGGRAAATISCSLQAASSLQDWARPAAAAQHHPPTNLHLIPQTCITGPAGS